jgi:septal ring-binding cell division protein DamX
MPSLGEMGGGMPSLGTGASGFGQQLADLIGGLVGSSGDAPADAQGLDPPNETDRQGDNADQEAKTEPADTADESAPDEEADAPDAAAPDETETEAKPTPEPTATPVPPPPDPALPVPPAVPEALPTEQTPCEIAADELPQVGE